MKNNMSSGSIIFKQPNEQATQEAEPIMPSSSPSPTTTQKSNNNNNSINNNNNNETTTTTNRLAPYNPTHTTAQSTALDLLNLTSHDIFFDLGCGDGRLIIAALERYYDDDYLMRVHQERFARLSLQPAATDASLTRDETPPHPLHRPPQHHHQHQQQSQKPPQLPPHLRQRSISGIITSPSPNNNSNNNITTINNNPQYRKIQHVRSQSTDYSVPHLMRTPSHEYDDESEGTGISSTLLYAGTNNNNEAAGNYNNNAASIGTNNSVVDILSTLSPSPSHQHPSSVVVMPTSPITPIAHNRRVGGVDVVVVGSGSNVVELPPPFTLPPLYMPMEDDDDDDVVAGGDNNNINNHDNNNNNNNTPQHILSQQHPDHSSEHTPNNHNNEQQQPSLCSSGIPKTIETPTPSPDGKNNLRIHAPQISELPTGLSLSEMEYQQIIMMNNSQQVNNNLASVPSGEVLEHNGFDGSFGLVVRDDILNHPPMTTKNNNNHHPSVVEAIIRVEDDGIEGVLNNHNGGNHHHGGAIDASSPIVIGNVVGNVVGNVGGDGGIVGGGLQCVGIEYNQALAESAQVNLQQSYIYPHVDNKVCIRWGDVLDEWNNHGNDDVVDGKNGKNGKYGNYENYASNEGSGTEIELQQHRASKIPSSSSLPHQFEGGDHHDDASKLTLLNDATAVFVYLLPQGLKKVKPLLYEAAVRRKRQQEERLRRQQQQQQERQQQQEQNQQQLLLLQPQHPLQQHPLQQQRHQEDPLLHPLHRQPLQQQQPPQSSLLETTEQTSRAASGYYANNITSPPCCYPPLPAQLSVINNQQQHQQHHHRKDYSHVSDITDYDDFRSPSRGVDGSGGGLEFVSPNPMVVPNHTINDHGGDHGGDDAHNVKCGVGQTNTINDDATTTINNNIITIPPSFRVVSYMFSIPGWTPSKIDRSSKGSCPLYLYENIHEEERSE